MWNISYIFLCSFVVAVAENEVYFERDRPYLKVKLHGRAQLECCHAATSGQRESYWLKQTRPLKNLTEVQPSERISIGSKIISGKFCGTVLFEYVHLNDTAMYHCYVTKNSTHRSYGTYMQVYRTIDKTLNLSEKTKNRILIVEGSLLLLCVLVPSFTLLFQSKRLQELEKKKALKEEENIYQGLTLDDCSSTYDQIERSQNHGPYQDVCNTLHDDIQLEKP
ncbi:B-cell antigen receptor complex-associated protein alpha chain [Nelusetta ayraudi]|uniref:B-cell antigen receptor complex-associated protein alpha chain n=1 Tax=Nelusetta ayraudi TaxID=303726 RepID=UPI003F6ED342